jgi:hypothetical protein
LEPEVLNKINELPPNNGENQCWAGISMWTYLFDIGIRILWNLDILIW